MSKQQEEVSVGSSSDPQQELAAHIKKVLAGACDQREGLILPVGMRRHRQVNEYITFNRGALSDVIVKSDFSFVLVLNGERYHAQSKASNCAAIMHIRGYVKASGRFEFPSGVSFATNALAETVSA